MLLSSFWYADALGLAARRGVRTYCRQTLVGGHYGLLRAAAGGRILLANPDFWVAWFWRRLMGRTALDVGATTPRWLRVYAHCGPRGGIALCVVNVDVHNRISHIDDVYHNCEHTKRYSHVQDGDGHHCHNRLDYYAPDCGCDDYFNCTWTDVDVIRSHFHHYVSH